MRKTGFCFGGGFGGSYLAPSGRLELGSGLGGSDMANCAQEAVMYRTGHVGGYR